MSVDLFEESFRFVLPGFNVSPLELEGALGVEQMKHLPEIIQERRNTRELLNRVLKNHPQILIQKEIRESSWFGFSLVLRPGCVVDFQMLLKKLQGLALECQTIVAGNFAKNEVIRYFYSELHVKLINADHIDRNGLFICNYHYPIPDACEALSDLLF